MYQRIISLEAVPQPPKRQENHVFTVMLSVIGPLELVGGLALLRRRK